LEFHFPFGGGNPNGSDTVAGWRVGGLAGWLMAQLTISPKFWDSPISDFCSLIPDFCSLISRL
jgi:hypothetical protein